MDTQNSEGFLPIPLIVLLGSSLIKDVVAGGRLQITLMSYIFSYNVEDVTTGPPLVNNLTVPVEFIHAYKPQWRLSGLFNQDHTQADIRHDLSQNNSSRSSVEWPWVSKVDCSGTSHYRFLVCLDYENSYDPRRPCSLERIKTELIPVDIARGPPSAIGGESVTFSNFISISGSNHGAVSNPFRIEFSEWKESVRMAVYVDCCGGNPDFSQQCYEAVHTTLNSRPRPFIERSWPIRHRLSGRGSLVLSTSAVCDSHFFGSSCDVFCKVDNAAQEHTFCNSTTGQKQCLPGWRGPDCQTDIDECQKVVCQNGGACINQPGSFQCACTLGTRGRYCEQRFAVCHLQPCKNSGTCLDTSAGPQCACAPRFSGQWCQIQLEEEPELIPTSTERPVTLDTTSASTTSPAAISAESGKSRVSDSQEVGGWQHWYLAVILGVLLLAALALFVIIFAVRRVKIRHGYKVPGSLPSRESLNLSVSTQEHNSFNNATYQLDDTASIIVSTYQLDDTASIIVSNDFHVTCFRDRIYDKSQENGCYEGDKDVEIEVTDKVFATCDSQGSLHAIRDKRFSFRDQGPAYLVKELRNSSDLGRLPVDNVDFISGSKKYIGSLFTQNSSDSEGGLKFMKPGQGATADAYAVSSCVSRRYREGASNVDSGVAAEATSKETESVGLRNCAHYHDLESSSCEDVMYTSIADTESIESVNVAEGCSEGTDCHIYEEIDGHKIVQIRTFETMKKLVNDAINDPEERKDFKDNKTGDISNVPSSMHREDEHGYLSPVAVLQQLLLAQEIQLEPTSHSSEDKRQRSDTYGHPCHTGSDVNSRKISDDRLQIFPASNHDMNSLTSSGILSQPSFHTTDHSINDKYHSINGKDHSKNGKDHSINDKDHNINDTEWSLNPSANYLHLVDLNHVYANTSPDYSDANHTEISATDYSNANHTESSATVYSDADHTESSATDSRNVSHPVYSVPHIFAKTEANFSSE